MSRRTVLFCSQTASAIGGVEEWLDRLCAGLDPSKWQARVALVRGSKVHDPDGFRAAHPSLDTVEIDGRGLPQEGRIRAVMRCVEAVRPHIFVPLVVADAHIAAARLRARDAHARYLLTLHGHTPPQLIHARELLPFVDLAVGPGRLTATLLQRLGMPADRVRYIPNGARPATTVRRERSPGTPLRIGYVGRLTSGDKRAQDLVPIARGLQSLGVEFRLVIVGDGPERKRIADELVGAPVQFLGPVSHDRLYAEIYPELDVLVLCSRSESFGIVLVEAMQHGVVPVCSDYLGRSSEGLVRQGENGLVFPVGDAARAAELLSRLAADEAERQRLSVAAQAGVSGRYGWPDCVGAWQAALDECMSLPARTVPGPDSAEASVAFRGENATLPAGVLDAVRRVRRAVLGVPTAMHGGEEWPWVPLKRAPGELEAMQRLCEELDA
jgi:glycosyltransferase involved in cell wall biosynthesis